MYLLCLYFYPMLEPPWFISCLSFIYFVRIMNNQTLLDTECSTCLLLHWWISLPTSQCFTATFLWAVNFFLLSGMKLQLVNGSFCENISPMIHKSVLFLYDKCMHLPFCRTCSFQAYHRFMKPTVQMPRFTQATHTSLYSCNDQWILGNGTES